MKDGREAQVLTAWEAKERAGLLALETEEWREKRRIAEDPDTTADVLECLAKKIEPAHTEVTAHLKPLTRKTIYVAAAEAGALLTEAIAKHPNTSPDTLSGMFQIYFMPISDFAARGMCRNPLTPFIALERPGFWQDSGSKMAFSLLTDESLPRQVAVSLTRHHNEAIAVYAKLHISVAGKLQTQAEGQAALTQYWKTYCSNATDVHIHRQHAEMVRFGIVPIWAMGMEAHNLSKAARLRLRFLAFSMRPLRRALDFLISISVPKESSSAFVQFVFSLEDAAQTLLPPCDRQFWLHWEYRLVAALHLPLTDSWLPDDPWNRSPLDLLQHLAHDGNRFVRWAAQTRLADPDFVFTWAEE